MIGYLQGEVLENTDGKLLVGIGEKQGSVIGYQVSVPQGVAYASLGVGQAAALYIYSHIREDVFDLYGFSSRFEKELYLMLLSVNGIGPKLALGVLSAAQPEILLDAIMNEDQKFLTQIPGIGKKTAERVVVELRDSVRKKVEAGGFTRSTSAMVRASAMAEIPSGPGSQNRVEQELMRDAKAALLTLGYRENDVHSLLKKVLEESQPRPQRAEDLIKSALRQLV